MMLLYHKSRGRITDLSLLQPVKAPLLRTVTLSGILMLVMYALLQPSNAPSKIASSDAGRGIDLRLDHPRKAYWPICSSVSGTYTYCT